MGGREECGAGARVSGSVYKESKAKKNNIFSGIGGEDGG